MKPLKKFVFLTVGTTLLLFLSADRAIFCFRIAG